jgi:outer membrane protein assembly factor BamA
MTLQYFENRPGWSLRATSELAGLGFDDKMAKFLKLQLQGQYAVPMDSEGTTFHVEGSAGIIMPWHSQYRTRVSDRFFLGGICPDGLRGFRMKGVGPSAGRRPNAADQVRLIGFQRTLSEWLLSL